MTPSWIELALLVLGSYRLTRLVGWDEFPLAARIRARAIGEEGFEPTYRRPTLAHLVHCPFCLGWWISLAAYLAWLVAPTATLYALAPLAISGAVGLVAKNLDP